MKDQAEPRVAPSARRDQFTIIRRNFTGNSRHTYTRGRAQGGARGSLPFQITNTSDRFLKGLEPGQTATIDQVERDGKLGYYPKGKVGVQVGSSFRKIGYYKNK